MIDSPCRVCCDAFTRVSRCSPSHLALGEERDVEFWKGALPRLPPHPGGVPVHVAGHPVQVRDVVVQDRRVADRQPCKNEKEMSTRNWLFSFLVPIAGRPVQVCLVADDLFQMLQMFSTASPAAQPPGLQHELV